MKPPAKTGQIGNTAEARYWRSIGEAAGTPEHADWAENEFPEGAAEASADFSRRDFLKLMGASAGLAGAGMLGVGCRRPEEHIVPFGKESESGQNYVHGVPMQFATAMPTRTGAVPLLVESNEGRPTKVEGNPDHPDSNGATDLFTQASILNLYDPDRARKYSFNGKVVSKADTVDKLKELANDDKKTAFLMPAANSPSRAELISQIKNRPGGNASFYVHEAIDFDVHQRAASKAFEQEVRPYWKLDQAEVILSLDCDFIGTEEESHRHIRDFARGRKLAAGKMSRLYVAEALMTQTGANADHRLRAKPSSIMAAAAYVAKQLGIEVDGKADGLSAKQQKWLEACAKDLQAHEGKGLVVAGYRQPEAVHYLIHQINEQLKNNGATVVFLPAEKLHPNLQDLKDDLGRVDRIINLGCNPFYDAAADLKWAEAAKGKTAFRLADHSGDESTEASGTTAPRAHYLESWGDARTSDGTYVPVQPLIAPLFDAMNELEVLAIFANPKAPQTAHEVVQSTFEKNVPGQSWQHFLHAGFQKDSAAEPVENLQLATTDGSCKMPPASGGDKLEVVFTRDYSVDDGRFANNGWCQELPDPITKITWDNVMSVSQKTAKTLKLKNGHMAQLMLDGRSVSGPVWVQPGMADNTVALPLGYGREGQLRIANFKYLDSKSDSLPVGGFDAYQVRTTDAPNFAIGGTLKDTGESDPHPLSTTQEHWSMEGRAIVREATLDEYKKTENFATEMGMKAHARDEGKLYQHPYKERSWLKSDIHQWGMSIDLSACVGCSACVIACQSENNIPIVGKEQVAKGREMHWLRIDRYYTGAHHNPLESIKKSTAGDDVQHTEDWIVEPQVLNQPMLCQHCESAPCEMVCPVNATVHDEEGINVMAYNRCVGTRYCSNNCAWKVRRFNYFDYHKRPLNELYQTPLTKPSLLFDFLESREKPSVDKDEWDLLKLVKNPDVSVRMRGVMEKCTYCQQRIEAAKIQQKVKAGAGDDVMVKDGAIKTACEQACPAEAITFGNILDKTAAVVKEKKSPRDYEVLGFLDTQPRTTYLAKIRNPNAKMPDAYSRPFSTKEYDAAAHGDEPHDGHENGDHKGDGH
jgi:molybdopterin-containing oxidoreductase family iron-sulfur binding subunit